MYIGYLADIVFYTALDNVLTVSDVTRSGSARWEKHNLMLEKPVKQFSGPDVEQITCKILISASLGQSPDSTVKKLRNYRDTGLYYRLLSVVNLLVKTTLSSCL